MRRLQLPPFFPEVTPSHLLAFLMLLFHGCKDEATPPLPPHISTVQLTLEEAGVTEVWLKLKLTDSTTPRGYALRRDTATILSGTLTGQDSILLDTSANPRHTYSYKAFRLNGTMPTDSSTPLKVTTMDTTSHDIVWEMDTLGDGNGSVLYDVAIINDTLAYAVGEMYLRDSTGQFEPQAYNMAKWDGVSWQLMRIQFYTICGQLSRTPYPAKAIFSFSATDIWIAMNGDQVARWNGIAQTAPMCLPVSFSINKLWGENPNSVYAVGWGGNIMHYTGTTWQRVESGTTLDFHDIWGARNPRTGEMEILALASTVNGQIQESRIVQITGNAVSPVTLEGLAVDMWGIWFAPESRYYAVGSGIHQKRLLNDSLWVSYPPGVVTSYLSGGVRGTGINDVFVAGSFGEVVHFNGVSWHRYFGGISLPTGAYGSIAITNHLVMTVGHISANRGVVLIGRYSK